MLVEDDHVPHVVLGHLFERGADRLFDLEAKYRRTHDPVNPGFCEILKIPDQARDVAFGDDAERAIILIGNDDVVGVAVDHALDCMLKRSLWPEARNVACHQAVEGAQMAEDVGADMDAEIRVADQTKRVAAGGNNDQMPDLVLQCLLACSKKIHLAVAGEQRVGHDGFDGRVERATCFQGMNDVGFGNDAHRFACDFHQHAGYSGLRHQAGSLA